jgi:UDP-N-acetylglucosamine--N-acetylmuramyl-(pentapeptide) pyrophosphoryl-undecaprenol N-acetylglucosamine transferase
VEELKKVYQQNGLEAEVVSFIEDMGKAYAEADLCIARSGAISVSEIATLGKPAILVPYPHAADNHQEANARALASREAAILVLNPDLCGKRLAQILTDFSRHPQKFQEMGRKAQELHSFRAARDIVDACQILAA